MRRLNWMVCALALAGLAGCDDDTTPESDGGGQTGVDGGTTPMPGTDGGTDPTGEDAGGDPLPDETWTFHAHPCAGNRTDTLWIDADGTAFVGCGSTTTGEQGFYVSTDSGESWTKPTTNPAGFFDTWRVQDISRSSDGLLYVAGTASASRRVVSVDTSAEPWDVALVLEARPTVGWSFTVGSFRRNDAGFAIAESLTGTDILFRPSDDAEWMDGSAWDDDHGGLQILQLVEHDGRFFGSGSTISNPPYLFISNPPGEEFGFRAVQLATGLGEYNGEMWGLAVDDSGIVLGGVNQDRNVGMIYALEHGSNEVRVMDVSTFHPDDTTWIRGVCRRGDVLFAVGELSSKSEGLAFASDDNGSTWREVTPFVDDESALPPVHRCYVAEDGAVSVAGADGMFAIYRGE